MLKKLGRSITIANIIAFFVVIIVGAVSIYFTKKILSNANNIREESRNVVFIDNLNTDAYRLVLAIHHFLIDADEIYSNEAISLISKIKENVVIYKSYEEKGEYEGSEEEIKLLNSILSDIQGLNKVKAFFEEFAKTGKYNPNELIALEEFAYGLEDATKKINSIHFKKIERWLNESLLYMKIILSLYLIFIIIGGISIFAGHRILQNRVVKPIKDLAEATIEFADGKLDRRVYTNSKTEIGQLYASFNRMAEKLQQNDEILRRFNEELEKKVKERTQELQRANEQLQKTQRALIRTEKIAAVGQIAAGVTHEIKNPLNSLSINTQMLMREISQKFGKESSLYETASLIKDEISRINNILEEFVKFARFPEPQFQMNDINSVVREVVDLVSSDAEKSGITIDLSLQERIPEFKFDARQMKEVLINLLQNAIKAINGKGRISIETGTSDDGVILRVSDNGSGIPEKYMDKIFTPFFSAREGGLGLGLSIVQRIVENHGGKITCRSKEGSGTTFEIILPFEREE